MESIKYFIDLFLHLDKHLTELMDKFGSWTYVILFAIVFAETGLVVTPFLPGDSLLFAAGALTALEGSPLQVHWLILALCVAAILGDGVNYHVGKFLGPQALKMDSRFLKKKHLDKTHQFFEKYGGKTIIIARFIPIVRTFAPFVAGVGEMSYAKFLTYNVIGGLLWVVSFVLAGHFFGQQPLVKKNFSLVIVAIIVISILPGVYEYFKARQAIKAEKAASSPRD